MVTCNNIDSISKKMTRPRRGSTASSGFRLLDGIDKCDTVSTISRNSIYKQKIDLMFDDTRSIVSQRIDGRNASTTRNRRTSIRSSSSFRSRRLSHHHHNNNNNNIANNNNSNGGHNNDKDDDKYDSKFEIRVNNSIQAQIEKMFTDVARDATSCSFPVRCLGALPLKDKVTSLYGLQEPLRQLYLSGAGHGNQNAGNLDICVTGLRVRLTNGREPQMTPFHNIAVWSAVKFVVSSVEGGAAFLPLITDPENIDKGSLFRPLSAADKRRLSSGLHAPIFAVVMRGLTIPKQLECHAFVCQTAEDAIVIAATLYQSLMAHMNTCQNQIKSKPRNQNGVSCVSIASSSVTNNNRFCVTTNATPKMDVRPPPPPPPPLRKSSNIRVKRGATSSLSGDSDIIHEISVESTAKTTSSSRKKKSHKTKRAPPIPDAIITHKDDSTEIYISSPRPYVNDPSTRRSRSRSISPNCNTKDSGGAIFQQNQDQSNGDILTRVAIPRSGSFLNTSGLTRYKSRATRRTTGKSRGTGGGGGSPLGFSELFNEFRLQENLHSLDEILNAIINSDGMSFNDLKPIYKEFLLKLAVTLTKDELYQRSKSIMRRQKKKKLRRKTSNLQKQRKPFILSAKGLKQVFWFGRFRARKNKISKQSKINIKIEKLSSSTKKDDRLTTKHATSGSDVSEPRNEHTINPQNRNSSSGYVSCSECSYDSEACTCISADRCYCSLDGGGGGGDHVNATKLNKTAANRESMFSCHTEDKCYCSNLETTGISSGTVTSCCDTDSCASNSKCYCKRKEKVKKNKQRGYQTDNLALDYELFTINSASGGGGGGGIGGNEGNAINNNKIDRSIGKHLKSHEALSVKKSVEVAALFSDVKLSQTTDITSLTGSKKNGTQRSASAKSNSSKHNRKKSANRIDIEKSISNKQHSLKKLDNDYQSVPVRPVSTSLEHSLGYLP